MSNKVTVIGFTKSGKTTYLAGMYTMMSAGRKNFSLIATDPNLDLFLDNIWGGICKGNFPLPSDNIETFTFHIAHNYKPVCEFNWLDYPGGILADPNSPFRPELNKNISDADCLMLVLDGEIFDIEALTESEYREKLMRRLEFDNSLRNETKALTRLSAEGQHIPPIAIVVTKCDRIKREYQSVIEEVIRNNESLKGVFEGNDLVMTAAVSLGANIDKGAQPDPYNIEQPIAFAVLVILAKYMTLLKSNKIANISIARKSRGFFSSLLNSGKIAEAEKNLEELTNISDKWSEDASKLIELFPDKKSIYINGSKMGFRNYFRDVFSELAK